MKHRYFDCECDSTEHVLRFSWFEDDPDDPYLYLSTYLHAPSFWKRVWLGVRYIFGYHCRYGHWDCTSLSEARCKELAKFLVTRTADNISIGFQHEAK